MSVQLSPHRSCASAEYTDLDQYRVYALPYPKNEKGQYMKKSIWDLIKDFLVLLIIPAFAWIIKIEVQNATSKVEGEQQDKAILTLGSRLDDYKELDKKMQAYAIQEARLEGKIDSVTEKITEIKALINAPK